MTPQCNTDAWESQLLFPLIRKHSPFLCYSSVMSLSFSGPFKSIPPLDHLGLQHHPGTVSIFSPFLWSVVCLSPLDFLIERYLWKHEESKLLLPKIHICLLFCALFMGGSGSQWLRWTIILCSIATASNATCETAILFPVLFAYFTFTWWLHFTWMEVFVPKCKSFLTSLLLQNFLNK